ncbi:DUF2157 domain-containing protein [Marinobacter sp. F3R08]|uniref:DUF2157 domain-containing protein n=1 Tax=Marinobacter sp. F3R08 TaxID=2841559 RepID=UPI001C09A94D|nr:DUF2157 domain-containing protein [Marinobacter sp. F3R08]MBU2953083.1 DUF2157 domain-containing protein [Marinobacter sp. F3R08]
MELKRSVLDQATRDEIITKEQADQLWALFSEHGQQTPSFRFTHILYYLGGLIAIGAMSLFMTLSWELFGGWGLLLIAVIYAGAGLWLTEVFLHRMDLKIPAGITATFVVVLTPLAVFGFQAGMGWWSDDHEYRDYHRFIDWSWLFMELATLVAGAIMLWRYRLPFLVMPVAVTLWYMSMDLTPFLFDKEYVSWELRRLVSLWFGLLITLLALWVDIRNKSSRDFSFWLYIFGVTAFWTGLSFTSSSSEWSKLLYCLMNVAMILTGATLGRRVFVVFGGLGVAGYLGYLAYEVFKESLMFPIALTFIGLGIIWLGILWQRNEQRLADQLRGVLPVTLRELIARRR